MHKPRCSCPQCYVGRPHTKCSPDPKCEATEPRPASPTVGCDRHEDCPTNLACDPTQNTCVNPCATYPITCGASKKCEVRHHHAMCVCKGFVVNNMGELTCKPDTIECGRDDECPSNRACVNSLCQDPCRISKKPLCGADKTCEVLNHKPICLCMENCSPSLSICLKDTGCSSTQACRNFKCVDPCKNATCPQNAPCYVEDHKPVCKFCPPGFAPDQTYGCLKGNNWSSVLSKKKSI